MIINNITFFLLLATYFIWWLFIRFLRLQKSIYFFSYYILTGLIFIGPIIYFKLGFTGYITSISTTSVEQFMIFGSLTNVINLSTLLFVKLFLRSKSIALKKKINNNEDVFKIIFNFSILTFTFFFLFYLDKIPIINLILQGEIGERLDGNGEIPYYITTSSFFMIYVPTAYLYYNNKRINRRLKYILLGISILALVFGGNKGLVAFFLLMLYFFSEKKKISHGIILLTGILFTYAVFKGRTSLDEETINYLTESPVRRLLAAQGVGFITRIEMSNKGLLTDNLEIKKQVNSYIYNTPYGTGSSPTNFSGTLYVKYGFFMAFSIYYIVSLILTFLLIRIHHLNSQFLFWPSFYITFLLVFTDFTTATAVRIFLLVLLLIPLKYNLK